MWPRPARPGRATVASAVANTYTVDGEEKPRLRGVSHQVAFFAVGLANLALLTLAEGTRAKLAVLIYALSMAFLYGVSATYHRRTWTGRGLERIRRLDHSAIFLLIAGSYTPLFMVLLPASYDGSPLLLVWLFASLGVAKSMLWSKSPGWITTVLAIAAGWCAVSHVLALASAMGSVSFTLLLMSGIVYTLGGTVYALRKPDPLPKTFGYHEVFHALVITGGALHYGHLLAMLSTIGAV